MKKKDQGVSNEISYDPGGLSKLLCNGTCCRIGCKENDVVCSVNKLT